jgi:rRNA-processing protein FCF1
MKKKSNWLYKKNKKERRRIKTEIKNSPKNIGDIKVATELMNKFLAKQNLEKDEKIHEEQEQKQFKQKKEDEQIPKKLEKKQKEIKDHSDQDSTTEKEILRNEFKNMVKSLDRQYKDKKKMKLIQKNASNENYDEKLLEIDNKINETKRELHKTSLKLLKKPQNLKNKSLDDSMNIILDVNAIIDMISSYARTHRIKILCPHESSIVVVPDFVMKELESKHVRGELSYHSILSEINGIFGEKIKSTNFNSKIDGEIKSIMEKYPGLSRVGTKCLLYGKYEKLIVISSDKDLKDACKIENVKYVDHFDHEKYSQTINSNYEDWFVGKIQRMKKYWKEVQESKTKNDSEYLEKQNIFRALFHDLLDKNFEIFVYLQKIFTDTDSLPKKAEKFFDLLPEKSDLTLDDIDIAINNIPN